MSFLLLELLRYIGISIAIGASTVMTAQWLAATDDQEVSSDELRLLSLVRMVSRVGFMLALVSHGLYIIMQINAGVTSIAPLDQLIFLFLAVIFITQSFYSYAVIKTTESVTVQTATWYALGILLGTVQLMPVNADAFLYAYLFFTIFSVYLMTKIQSQGIVTHKTLDIQAEN